jgi:hypothetical protein
MRSTMRSPKNKNSAHESTQNPKNELTMNRIIRIIFIIPVFAITSFLSVAFNNTSIYLAPLQTLYESFALSAFFFLLLAYVQEDDDEREAFFEASGLVAAYRVGVSSQRVSNITNETRKRRSVFSNSRW